MAQADLNGNAPTYGDLVEEWACTVFGLDYHDETYYDAVTTQGVDVQIKGCKQWVGNGYYADGTERRCRGRFKFFEGDHDTLAEEGGVYLLIVYEDDGDDEDDESIDPVAYGFFTPDAVEEVVDGDWYSEGDRRERKKGLVYRTTWNSFFDPEVVDDE